MGQVTLGHPVTQSMLCAPFQTILSMLQAIVQGIEATEIVPGRCEVIDEEQDFGVVVDSANDPKSLSLLLDNIRRIDPRRIILVTGCEGEVGRDSRPFLGEIAHYKVPLGTPPSLHFTAPHIPYLPLHTDIGSLKAAMGEATAL